MKSRKRRKVKKICKEMEKKKVEGKGTVGADGEQQEAD